MSVARSSLSPDQIGLLPRIEHIASGARFADIALALAEGLLSSRLTWC